MFFRSVATLSVILQVTVSLLGHFGLHALLGDSHCPAVVHGTNSSRIAASDSRAGDTEEDESHAGCCHVRTAHDDDSSTHESDAANPQNHQHEQSPAQPKHTPHDEHSCELCSVLAQAQTAPSVVASPSPTVLLTELLTELDIASVESPSARYESRGPPRC